MKSPPPKWIADQLRAYLDITDRTEWNFTNTDYGNGDDSLCRCSEVRNERTAPIYSVSSYSKFRIKAYTVIDPNGNRVKMWAGQCPVCGSIRWST